MVVGGVAASGYCGLSGGGDDSGQMNEARECIYLVVDINR